MTDEKKEQDSGEEVEFFDMSPGSYQNYRDRVMDSISPSFCAAKWYNATIWLGAGITASCHHPRAHPIPLGEVRKNYKAIHNTEFKKEQRKKMLEGKRPAECEYCWNIEDIGRNNVSDRVFKTVIYKEKDIASLKNSDWTQNVDLKTLEISFDRTCNFACSYCNPGFSSTWVKDIKENGGYTQLRGDGIEHYATTNDWGQLYKTHEPNPYIEAFWNWWPELSKSLFELRVTGGEPTMSPHFWKLLDWFAENVESKIRFAANTNLSGTDDTISKLIQYSRKIKTFDLYTSCETYGQHAEYIRDGLKYESWRQNLVTLAGEGSFRKIVIMMTVNALSLFQIVEFLDDMLKIKSQFTKDFPVLSVNILRYPSFQSASILPDHIKQYSRDRLSAWYESHKNSDLLHQFEKDGIERLIDYLDIVKTPNPGALAQEKLQEDFKSFFIQYDKRRNKNINHIFPSLLTDWLKTI